MLLWLASAFVMFPFLWIAGAAFKTQIALLSGAVLFTPVLANFQEVLFSRTSEYLDNFLNSTVVGLGSTAAVLVIGTMGAWSVSRARWPSVGRPRGDGVGDRLPHDPADHHGGRVVRHVPDGRPVQHPRGPDPGAPHL